MNNFSLKMHQIGQISFCMTFLTRKFFSKTSRCEPKVVSLECSRKEVSNSLSMLKFVIKLHYLTFNIWEKKKQICQCKTFFLEEHALKYFSDKDMYSHTLSCHDCISISYY